VTLFALLLLVPSSLLSPRGTDGAAPGNHIPVFATPILQDQAVVIPAIDPGVEARGAGEESTDDEKAKPSRLAPAVALGRRRDVRPSHTGLTSGIMASSIRSPLLRC
jgi:hypothetical protein